MIPMALMSPETGAPGGRLAAVDAEHRSRNVWFLDSSCNALRHQYRRRCSQATRRRTFRVRNSISRTLQRLWVEDGDAGSPLSFQEGKFLIMSYNILGVTNASRHSDLYNGIPWKFVTWESRKKLICQEIDQLNPDLVCLQEVDRFRDISDYMKRNGYAGSYHGRSGGANDGCAAFWKEKRFRLLEEVAIDFSMFNLRNNVAQLLVFEVDGAGKLVVGNIHVLFNPRRGDIKLGQIRLLLTKAYDLSRKWGDIPLVLAGDFNSTPESAIYSFFSKNELNVSLHDRRFMSGLDPCRSHTDNLTSFYKYQWTDDELENATGYSKRVEANHPLKLRSSYASVKSSAKTRGPNDEPLATSCHSKFLGTVDYIWYSIGLKCIRVLDTVPIDILKQMRGLPNKDNGSDHLPLVAEFIVDTHRSSEQQIKSKRQRTTSNTVKKANTLDDS